ncbi:MAG: AAA family ATPase [Theionarchaea archaeon]|nr:AAA family ATPase [Theionarchaea archaeon]
MILTVGGFAGSGTTTLCRKLAQHFNLTHVYAGKIFRDMASARGMSLQEFSKQAERDETIDFEVDREQKKLAMEGSVVEGRITAHLVNADMKIWLTAPLSIRADRISMRESISPEEAMEGIIEREASEKKRYLAYYQIDIDDLTPYDLILNTTLWDAEGVFHIVKNALEVRTW